MSIFFSESMQIFKMLLFVVTACSISHSRNSFFDFLNDWLKVDCTYGIGHNTVELACIIIERTKCHNSFVRLATHLNNIIYSGSSSVNQKCNASFHFCKTCEIIFRHTKAPRSFKIPRLTCNRNQAALEIFTIPPLRPRFN